MNLEWYVLQVMTGREMDVANAIREKGLAEPLVPTRILKERHNSRTREVSRTIFPSYVFLHMILEVSAYYKITSMPNTIKLLGMNGGKPQPIPESEMALVKLLGNDGKPFGISEAYRAGSLCRIRSGPLESLQARIVRVDTRRGRATVSIPLLNEERLIDLGIHLLKPTTSTRLPAPADSSPCMVGGDQG